MKLSKLLTPAGRLQSLAAVMILALTASLGAPAAQAAEAAPAFKIDPKVQAQSMTEAPGLIAAAKISCDPSDAYKMGETDLEKDGKKVKGSLYEIACKTGPGFMITAFTPTEPGQSFTCTLAEAIKAKQPGAATCVLPENVPSYKWLNTVVQPYIPGCVVNNARIMGSTPPDSTQPKIDRYEVGCESGLGGIIDYPQLASSAPVNYQSCLIGKDKGFPCQYTTDAALTASLKPLAAQADPKCQVSNVRFVGITKESDGYFYEFGCSNQPGFMVLSGNDNSFKRMIPCTEAAGLGGCTLTDMGTVAADAKVTYGKELKAAGYPCTVQDFTIIGSQPQTKRDFAEFKCPEQPWGLIGFVPQPGAQAAVHVNDCFIDQSNRKNCTYVTEPQLKAQLDKLIKIKEPGKDCDVAQVRYIGESADVEGALIAELACKNKRGYIVIVAPDRNSLLDSTPCKLAKAHGSDQTCTIPGNGTYTSGD
ncbi:hypothetical protein [Asticcacaulis sp. EMRT-3]|uniref:hypothetical protein n=1 Tax=Asticcacaulis sp. EMRT-3 TaxID=3040349 RepID=UPI0024AE9109|nr:hypothetical protein [Asticcacaulis sp. EMRT-3]MDI7774890.1 hypothetical protein [Asticcacaulis sp. EMRT-3]